MSSQPIQLRGSCQCGRNQYAIQIPPTSSNSAQIIFDSDREQRIASASPLSAFIRIPLTWYRSEIFPFFDDEARSNIRRSYASATERHAQRSFCGYCGTPLSYWSEQPPSEAEYIRLTLGSLLTEDLYNLQDLGLLPEDNEEEDNMDIVPPSTQQPGRESVGRRITGIPWFEHLISGSRLGNMRTTREVQRSRDGNVRLEVEITEWRSDDHSESGEGDADASESSSSTTGKRKRGLDSENDTIAMSAPFDA
ncbi:hypothetical protein GGS20DRAFT_5875 [Poronia punctata]|nr:hypothetical protein GGS20DRAFT_5875 [Poronia punctata]